MKKEIELKKLDTEVVSDALDYLGINGCCLGFSPRSNKQKICGRVFTVKFTKVKKGEPGPAADYIDEVPEGSVIFIDNDSIGDCTVWGSILTRMAKLRKINGTIINGACRDADFNKQSDYPIFSKHVYMRTGKNRVKLSSVNEKLEIGGVTVKPGDYALCDGSGVVIIPQESVADVIKKAKEIESNEGRIIKAINNGTALKEARKKNSYNIKPKK